VQGDPDCDYSEEDQRLAEHEERLPGGEVLSQDLNHP
jgi:hypothetical protein